ncbi:MAG: alkaline phosphatase [Thermoleophilia bacterium]|nr:alkaline phosphatase [Thermoleophilia bacterium]
MEALLEPIFSATLDALTWGGVWAVFALMTIESCCIPAPSELIMLFAGYLVYTGDATMLQVIAAGVLGNVLGSVLCWYIGAYGGRAFIDNYGKYIRLNHHHIELSERFFDRWGTATVFFTRNLPIIRTFISLPAGIARMPLGRFTAYTFLGCIPWVSGLAYIGYRMGPNWEHARDVLHNGDYVVVGAILLGLAWFTVRYLRRRGAARAGAAEA